SRRPLYIECTSSSLVFHPDRLTLLSPTEARDEAERRIARQRQEAGLPEGKEAPAYLMMLVRPDGIVTYYQASVALGGLKVDFGYEFIDADWVLDFSEANKTPQPWRVAKGSGAKPAPLPTPGTPRPPARAGVPAGKSGGPDGPGFGDPGGSPLP